MASRFLSSSLLRSRVVRPTAFRSLATQVKVPQTEISILSSGLTVATEFQPNAHTSTVGIFIDAGSRGDGDLTSGVAHFGEHLAFKGTSKRSQASLEKEVEDIGAHLNAYTSREQTVYYAKTLQKDVPQAVELISDILGNSTYDKSAVDRERGVILREEEEVYKQVEEVVFDHLHATAFQGHDLGRTILGPKKIINKITADDIKDYNAKNFTADKMVLVGAGAVAHEELVKLAEKHFSAFPTSANPLKRGTQAKKTEFTGSEVRIRDDEMPTLNVAIAVEGVAWNSPDYYTMNVMQAIMGNWDRSLGSADLLSSRFSTIVSSNNLANSFMSFSTSYSDTGLWGIYMVTENFTNVDDLVHFALREWARLSMAPREAEVARAKAQLKASMLLGLDGTTAVAEDIGRQILNVGARKTAWEIEAAIDAVTTADVQRCARKYLWDADIAVSAVGQTDGLLPYLMIRNDMSSMAY